MGESSAGFALLDEEAGDPLNVWGESLNWAGPDSHLLPSVPSVPALLENMAY